MLSYQVFQEWLELDKPDCFTDEYMSRRGLLVSLAKRMAFEPEFIKALKTKKYNIFTKDDLYSCYSVFNDKRAG